MYMAISQVAMSAGTAMIQARVYSRRPTSADSPKPASGRTSSSVTSSWSVVIFVWRGC